MELIRKIVRVGNSAGVVLPREWLNGRARVELIDKPLDIKAEIFEIIGDYLDEVEGIYLVGSYARGEENSDSDVDVLVITQKINKKIVSGKYEITLISKDSLKESLEKNIIPLLPMILEARAILNKSILEDCKNIGLNKKNTFWHIDSTKSILKVNRENIELDREKGFTGDAVAYSLVLRLREVYIVDCLMKNKMWSSKGLKDLIKKISGSLDIYKGYIRVKKGESKKEELSIEDAVKVYDYIGDRIDEQEKWLQKRK